MWLSLIADRFEVLYKVADSGLCRARDLKVGDIVALKIPDDQDEQAISLLHDEFRLRVEVQHPGLAPIRGLFEHHGRPVLAQQWVEGTDLLTLSLIHI